MKQWNYPRTKWVQQSPPAWIHEAYRPQRIKYSISCPILGDTIPGWGTADLATVPPPPPRSGRIPPSRPGRGNLPIQTWPWYPPNPDLAGIPPPDLAGVPPGCGQTKNITSRRTTYAVGDNMGFNWTASRTNVENTFALEVKRKNWWKI